MSGEELSRALGDISDKKIQDALTVYERKRKIRNIWLRAISVAAILAIILGMLLWSGDEDGFVTAPGVLKVYAYDLTSGNSIDELVSRELKQGVELPREFGWSQTTNCVIGLPILLDVDETLYEGRNISFHITVNGGEFLRDTRQDEDYLSSPFDKNDVWGCDFVIENSNLIYWQDMHRSWDESGLEDVDYYNGESVLTNIVIYADSVIVGYAVVEIFLDSLEARIWKARIIESVHYPVVNGEYQDVTEAYVYEKMSKCFRKQTGGIVGT